MQQNIIPVTSIAVLLLSLLNISESVNQCRAPTSPTAIYSETRLPQPEYGMSLIFDGKDSILIFNGRPDHRAVYSFNIHTEEITKLGKMLTKGTYAPLVRSHDGSYLYFGNSKPQRVFRFDPETNSGSIVTEFGQIGLLSSYFTSSSPNKVYLTSTLHTSSLVPLLNLYEFDTYNFCLDRIKKINGSDANVPIASFGNFAYHFTSGPSFSTSTQIYRETKDTSILGKTFVRFRNEPHAATTVTTSKYAYMMGGVIGRGQYLSNVDGILQYHPIDNHFNFIRIDEMPLRWGNKYENPPAMVYVEKLNRIYFFGGLTDDYYDPEFEMNRIWHIDVNLLEDD